MAILLLEAWDAYGGNATAALKNWAPTPAFTSSAGQVKTGTWALGGNGSGATVNRGISPGSHTVIFGGFIYWTGSQPAHAGCAVGFLNGGTS